ncbi:aquaporin AQPAe.a isoform X2 [Aethina tumida]|uniref:aquaporin AQPAe.a isoform X2 n=1 Tax=Aethina tumida TaxID=116153 RepID=UPI002147AA2A|nr:aquaporin AQPAe.a isoform X2 [Aethina tumida]
MCYVLLYIVRGYFGVDLRHRRGNPVQEGFVYQHLPKRCPSVISSIIIKHFKRTGENLISRMTERQPNGNNSISVSVIPSVIPSINDPPVNNKVTNTDKPKECKKGKKIQIGDNMTTVDRVVLFAGEVGGTAILVFLGCMGCVAGITSGNSIPHEQISWTFGLAVMVAVQIFGHISGSHINPVVTVAAATLGNIPLIQIPIYFAGQMFGALLGFGLLKSVTPGQLINASTNTTKVIGVCSPAVNPSITPYQGLLVEFLLTFILVLVCCGVWDSRNSNHHDSVPIRFGFAIAVLAMAGGPYTGANMNPVRSFAPALFNGDWDNHWLYWVGPLAAGFLGALLYRFIYAKDEEPQQNVAPEGIPLNDKA